ncbi:hypothetical protein BDF22DRAFT_696099 [Syncephalis plumigaleata]|nr:hypothetical protein BDF22DRAFT_696099 [Syncephalis plumigaleata]
MNLTESIRIKVDELRNECRQRYDTSCQLLDKELRTRTLQANQLYKQFEQAILQYQSIISSSCEEVKTSTDYGNSSQVAEITNAHQLVTSTVETTTNRLLVTNDTAISISPLMSSSDTITTPIASPCASPQLDNYVEESTTLVDVDTTQENDQTSHESVSIIQSSTNTTISDAREEAYRIDKEHKRAERLVQRTKHAIRRLRLDFQHQLRELDRLERRLCTITHAYELTQKQNLSAYLEEERSKAIKCMEHNVDDDDDKKSTKRSFLSLIDTDTNHSNVFNEDDYTTASTALRLSLWALAATAPTILWTSINNTNVYTSFLDYLSKLL